MAVHIPHFRDLLNSVPSPPHQAKQKLARHNGDLEAALPDIATAAPDLYPHFAQVVREQKTADLNRQITARKAAEENYKFQEGMPAEEVQVGQPGVTRTPPAVVPEGGTVAPLPIPQ